MSTGFELNLPRHAWASADVNYGSGFLDGNGPAHLGSHAESSMSLGKSFGERWSATFTALNFTNSRYLLDNSNTFGGTHFNFPSQFSIQIRYRFHY